MNVWLPELVSLVESNDPIAATMFDVNKHVFRAVEESQFFDEPSVASEWEHVEENYSPFGPGFNAIKLYIA